MRLTNRRSYSPVQLRLSIENIDVYAISLWPIRKDFQWSNGSRLFAMIGMKYRIKDEFVGPFVGRPRGPVEFSSQSRPGGLFQTFYLLFFIILTQPFPLVLFLNFFNAFFKNLKTFFFIFLVFFGGFLAPPKLNFPKIKNFLKVTP